MAVEHATELQNVQLLWMPTKMVFAIPTKTLQLPDRLAKEMEPELVPELEFKFEKAMGKGKGVNFIDVNQNGVCDTYEALKKK